MTGTLNVTPQQLRSTAQGFQANGNKVSTLTQQMMDLINQINTVWTGDASTKYQTKFKSLNDDIQRMRRMINEHVTDLNDMAAQYSSAEQQNIDLSNNLATDVIF